MTTLLVAGDAALEQHPGQPVVGLHDCLQGHWALLFSNPEDFAPHASTPPGFLTYLADGFKRARTKPFTVIHQVQQSHAATWLQHASDDRSLFVLDCAARRPVVDFATRALVRKLRRLEPPYVLVLDENGRCRSTISYRAQRVDRPRTVEELLCVVTVLRGDRSEASPDRADPARAAITP
jgi:alkyl hydroperoxide reductase subunit AhpC